MRDSDFEGTLVLEKMAEIDRLDEFWEAIDDDDFARASQLMKLARIDPETIAEVLKRLAEGGSH